MEETAFSPASRPSARLVGLVYLLYFILAIAGALVGPRTGIHDAISLRITLSAHEASFTLARTLDVLSTGIYLAVVVLLSNLFTSGGVVLARMAQVYGTAGCTIQIGAGLLQLAPATIYHLAPSATGLPEPELNAVAYLLYSVSAQAGRVPLIFFGLFCLSIGTLIVRSRLVPHLLGWLLIAASAGWLTFLWPPLSSAVSPVVLPFGFLAELLLMFWLLIRGVDTARQEISQAP